MAGLLSSNIAHAQPKDARWPERPIRLIVPFTAGSASDIIARLVAQKLGERLGQPLVVENRVGGGGAIGSNEVARADGDGYTLGLANTSTHAVAASLAPLPYDPAKDFAPVAMLGHSPFVLALYPRARANCARADRARASQTAHAQLRVRGPGDTRASRRRAVREDGRHRAHACALSQLV
jgi:tripartite-type tricarboxylate transporter receptor subunit TctC